MNSTPETGADTGLPDHLCAPKRMASHCLSSGARPVARLYEIQDMLTLALDATESSTGYTRAEHEARSYVRNALRQTRKLLGARS